MWIPKPLIKRILRGNLKMRKVCAGFVPHAFPAEQKKQCLAHVEDLLEMIANDQNFLDSIITGDESFTYYPETKRQDAEW